MHGRTAGGRSGRVRRRYLKAALLGGTALVVLAPGGLSAQEAARAADGTESTIVLDTVTIAGDKADNDARSIVATQTTAGSKMATDILDTPASISVITAREIQQRDAQSIEQVLQYTAGVTTDFYGSDDRFDYFKIRGFDAYMYRDGLPLYRPFGGVREDPYAYERVEVLKGANSTVFGPSDPGGAVNLVSKRPRSERFGEAYVTGGSFDHKEAGLDFGDNITGDDTLSYRITAKIKDSEKEYDFSQDDENLIMGGLTWRPTDMTTLTVIFDHLDIDGTPGSGGQPLGTDFARSRFFGEPDYNYLNTNRNTITALFAHDFGSGLSFNTNARFSKTTGGFGYAYIFDLAPPENTVSNRYFFANENANDNFVIDSYLKYEVDFENVESRSLVGVEYNRSNQRNDSWYDLAPSIDWSNPVYSGAPESLYLYSSTQTDQQVSSIYGQQGLTFFDKLILSVGLRNDWIDVTQNNLLSDTVAEGTFSEFTTRVGLAYRLTEDLTAFANYAESAAPTSSTVSIEPERGKQYEAGVKYRPADFPGLFTASVYDLTKTNVTVTDPVTQLESTIGEARVRGLDLEAKAELPNNLNLIAAYSYLDSRIVEDGIGGNVGNRLAFVPEHVASLWLDYKLPAHGKRGDMTFGFGARYSGPYYFDDANTMEAGGYTVFDAAFTYEIVEKTTFQLNVTNLFDKKYVAYGGYGANWYNPGREILVSLRRTW
ncbi:TonB-dependent siderophore receptor [Ancylobacter oerskovii]|uniref:TonB-dependent siderophore receptor n=1 Tax=Ancylobacter oerskovii TaxID=459519 RepID=A0ABW4YWC4_9HYPH|nr:TonB-dependent siderophore receptor [Ancylobacter oerskovii]MBS7544178.1 TonB-dependent siderophore receptor [Ancylobacter oerskovii]